MKRLIILISRLCKYVAPTKYFVKVLQIGRFMALDGVIRWCVESPLDSGTALKLACAKFCMSMNKLLNKN